MQLKGIFAFNYGIFTSKVDNEFVDKRIQKQISMFFQYSKNNKFQISWAGWIKAGCIFLLPYVLL